MISLIVAIGKNNVIGKNGELPWHYSEDLKYFKKVTTNHKVLMGKTTFDSIVNKLGKPLPNRHNIVVTHDENFSYQGVEVVSNLADFLKNHQNDDIFIIGGKQIYEQSLSYVKRFFITNINKEYDGDVYFPQLDYSKLKLISKKDSGELSFCVYQRMV